MIHKSMFDNFFPAQRPMFSLSENIWNPPTDIYEDDHATIIKMEVAGLEEDKFQVTVERNMLVVRGRRLHDHGPRVNYHLMEIHYGRFERAFAFSFSLRQEQVHATYDKGFLIIEVKKTKAVPTEVSIQIAT